MVKNNRYKGRGWHGESHRHYLAAKGIKTSRKYNQPKSVLGRLVRDVKDASTPRSQSEINARIQDLKQRRIETQRGIQQLPPEGIEGARRRALESVGLGPVEDDESKNKKTSRGREGNLLVPKTSSKKIIERNKGFIDDWIRKKRRQKEEFEENKKIHDDLARKLRSKGEDEQADEEKQKASFENRKAKNLQRKISAAERLKERIEEKPTTGLPQTHIGIANDIVDELNLKEKLSKNPNNQVSEEVQQ